MKKAAAKSATPRLDVHAIVTDKIVAMLEKGVRPWARSWGNGSSSGTPLPISASTGKTYRGINVLLLWATAMEFGYTSPYWMTYKQAGALKGQVRQGEKGTMVVYYTRLEKWVEKDGTKEKVSIPLLRTFTVFNADQVDDLPDRFRAQPESVPVIDDQKQRIESADAFFNNVPVTIKHSGSRAFFSPTLDYVQMPKFEDFHDAVAYYGTLGHECIHWTGHDSRLIRPFGKKFGDENYAREELVAELGAAFLCASLGLSMEPREDHASYLAHWITVLKEDKKAVFQASTMAQKAHDHLVSYQPEADTIPDISEDEVAEMEMA